MRILLMNHFPLTGSGSGVYTQNIADSLVKKGHEVCIIMPENENVTKQDKVKIHPVYFNNGNNIEGELPFNFPCFTTHPRSTTTFYNLTEEELNQYINAFQKALEEEIMTFNPDIIHAGHIWLLPGIAANYNIPLIITAHGTDLIGYQETDRYKKVAEHAAASAENIITISKENSDLVSACFPFAKEKTVLIPNGYNSDNIYYENTNKDEFLKQFGINRHYDKVVSFAGKFTSFKGIDLLLKAAQIYEDDDTLTVLAGDGELFDEMNNLAQTLNLNNIVFIKNQPHEILRKLYSIADVSLVTSRSEAFGLVVIEAMACGTPVIGTNLGGIPDIITEDTGMLFEPENFEELAHKVKQILNKEVVFDRSYIAQSTKNKYSQDEFVGELINIYDEALQTSKTTEKNIHR
ncbi:MAG: glycosyltransferase family 4 protein [Bacilli bacterium]|nr:glycosyltransferase family 4 protein [Bacilli bacterium]